MTKLKTIKEMDPEACCHGFRKRELKEEAIAWIKTAKQEENHGLVLCDGKNMFGIIAWIKHFFNLKEEDLK